MHSPPPRAILIDAGFTLVFPSGERIAELAAPAGVRAEPERIEQAVATLYPELGRYAWPSWPGSQASAANGPAFFRAILSRAGAEGAQAALDAAGEAVWRGHLARNVWAKPGGGVTEALHRMRAAGLHLAVVSNSEGTIAALVEELGWSRAFGVVIDSWVEGLVKPDPAIFHLAAARLGVEAAACVMVGDSPTADVGGALAAGMRAALIEPYGVQRQADVPRFADLPAFVNSLLDSRRGES